MKNVCLVISYIGTLYSGFQKQKNGLSVQEVIEKAIFDITGENSKLTPSGRTDSGVHALGQVANFLTNSTIPADKFFIPLNQILPQDIRIMESREVPISFNARKSAKQKTYLYKMYFGKVLSALDEGRVLHVKYSVDFDLMQKACNKIIGEHDFKAFMSSGSFVKTTTRKIYNCHLTKNGDYVDFEITGNGFLYNMVRILVGTILDIGRGKIQLSKLDELLSGAFRKDAGKTSPACALYLKEVIYE